MLENSCLMRKRSFLVEVNLWKEEFPGWKFSFAGLHFLIRLSQPVEVNIWRLLLIKFWDFALLILRYPLDSWSSDLFEELIKFIHFNLHNLFWSSELKIASNLESLSLFSCSYEKRLNKEKLLVTAFVWKMPLKKFNFK